MRTINPENRLIRVLQNYDTRGGSQNGDFKKKKQKEPGWFLEPAPKQPELTVLKKSENRPTLVRTQFYSFSNTFYI